MRLRHVRRAAGARPQCVARRGGAPPRGHGPVPPQVAAPGAAPPHHQGCPQSQDLSCGHRPFAALHAV
jgi:hypothetical protein